MASYALPRYTKSMLAAADLSAKQFYFVGDNGSDAYNVAGGANGDFGAGFLMNKPSTGEMCEVASVGGGAKCVLSEAVTSVYTELKAVAAGTCDIADTAGDVVVAVALQIGDIGDIIEVMPVLYRKHA